MEAYTINWPRRIEAKGQLETAVNIRWHLIVLELPGIYANKTEFCSVIGKLVDIKQEIRDTFIKWLNEYTKERFQRLVRNVKRVLNDLVFSSSLIDR